MTRITEFAFSAPFWGEPYMRFQGGICNPVLVYPLQRYDLIWPSKSKTGWFTQAFLMSGGL